MFLKSIYPYSKSVKYESNSPLIIDNVKKFLKIQDRNEYPDNEITKVYNNLLTVSKQLGLGENISIDTVYDGKVPEKVFTIHCASKLNKEQKYNMSELLHKHMNSFSKSEGLQDFIKDVYILIK